MFARSVGHKDPIFFDEAAAKARGYRSIVAPPGFLGTPIFRPGGAAAPGRDGRPRLQHPLQARAQRRHRLRVLPGDDGAICAGDTITARSKIGGFEETEGSLGPMLITTRETTYTNQHGKVVAKMYGTTIQY